MSFATVITLVPVPTACMILDDAVRVDAKNSRVLRRVGEARAGGARFGEGCGSAGPCVRGVPVQPPGTTTRRSVRPNRDDVQSAGGEAGAGGEAACGIIAGWSRSSVRGL